MGKKNLLQFLFGESQVDDEISSLVEEIADMDTAGVEDKLKVDKQPLDKALSALDIPTDGLEHDSRGLSLVFTDADAYRNAHALLNQPENLHKLAELGWVFSTQGDVAMMNEPAEFRIRFLEITDVEPQEAEPKPIKGTAKNNKLSAVIKAGREFATTKPEHDDGMNPVEYDDKTSGNRHKGMSKEKDGDNAEGSWSGKVKGAQSEALKIDDKAKKAGLVDPDQAMDPKGKPKGSEGSVTGPGVKQHAGTMKTDMGGKKAGLVDPEDGGDPKGKLKGATEAVAEALLDERGAHKPSCQCGFCKNKGNIHMRNKPKEEKPEGEGEMEESAEQIVDRILNGENPLQEVHPENVGTQPGIMGHKSFSTLKLPKAYPDRKFSPAKGMAQPDNPIVNQQSKRKVKSV